MNKAAAIAGAFANAVEIAELASIEAQWRDLEARAGEANPFACSAFLAPALRHIAPARLRLLAVWDDAQRRRLIGLTALALPKLGFGVAEVWRSEQAPSPSLLLDRDQAARAVACVIAWLRARRALIVGLAASSLDTCGGSARAIRNAGETQGLLLTSANPRKRAALAAAGAGGFEAALDSKRRKEWRRQRRRLEDGGALMFSWDASPAAIEAFLALEAAGWKGARGTALAVDAGRAAFTRAMLGAFAARGELQIARLALGERTIAAGVVLRAKTRAFYWKTAYDEAYAEFSPGVQLTLDMARVLERDPSLELTDSCALPGHPMIDRLWPSRIELADFILATHPGAAPGLSLALAARRARSTARERVKAALNRWRDR